MRLKHIHLAGFKSFVDPVTISAHAQLSGVVGPNGCGKSNVIDAVRWVLGESKARELRGESLQDVIFNGSANRKPASRASVEMLFDNSAGRAAGQWSQYAEIAVKRVLTRNGDSSYYINNIHVRRKDVFDLFLGTGLGGDAYAIIEQGMISRIIESRPEELRGYLEEAAGVSKYKERRRETESRLRDTRENLSRVDDIRQELEGQLEKLGVQAEVARRFFALSEDKSLKENLLALLRKRDAQARQARLSQDLERARNAIEARTAEVRRLETELEQARLAQFDATEAVNQAQARFYAEGGEATRLEQALRHQRENHTRLEGERQRAVQRQEQALAERQAAETEMALRQEEREIALARQEELEDRLRETGLRLPELEQALQTAQRLVAERQRQLSHLEHTAQLEASHRSHAERAMEQLKGRQARLAREREELPTAGGADLAELELAQETAQQRLDSLRDEQTAARQAVTDREQAQKRAGEALNAANRDLHRLEAELAALRKLQEQAARAESAGQAWLARVGLAGCRRLWQAIQVDAGWEDAVEAALGERLAALLAQARSEWLDQPPDARFDLALEADPDSPASPSSGPVPDGLMPLRQHVRTEDPIAGRLLDDWLRQTYACADLASARAWRTLLPAGGIIATPQGHLLGRESLTFNAPDKGHHGLLKRTREIEALAERLELERERHGEAQQQLRDAEAASQETRRRAEQLQAALGQAQAQAHQTQMALVKAGEAARRLAERRSQLEAELAEVAEQLAGEAANREEADARQQEARLEQEYAREHLDEALAGRQEAEQAVAALRERLRREERETQEAAFRVKTLVSRLDELAERLGRADAALDESRARLAELEAQLAESGDTDIQAALQAALARRETAERDLVAAREALETINQQLRDREQTRLRTERELEPLHASLQSVELKLQEARLKEAQYAEQLGEVDETALAARLAEGMKESALVADIERLAAEIAALGAVNMAALEELETTQQRKGYLDAQAADLTEAADTLEEAIRRIDAETRSRLKDTYDTVSREFRSLFTELFGGGEAALTLTGDEILDAGLVVMAQPPGKKNSSIHLLSGGEKALTAISLVFAFFRLNPAPFCLLDEVDAPLDDSNTERLCRLIRKMSADTQFMFITHNRITMEMAEHLVGVTMPEPGVSRSVAVDVEDALRLALA